MLETEFFKAIHNLKKENKHKRLEEKKSIKETVLFYVKYKTIIMVWSCWNGRKAIYHQRGNPLGTIDYDNPHILNERGNASNYQEMTERRQCEDRDMGWGIKLKFGHQKSNEHFKHVV